MFDTSFDSIFPPYLCGDKNYTLACLLFKSGSDRLANPQMLNNTSHLEVRLQPRQIGSQGATEVALPIQGL